MQSRKRIALCLEHRLRELEQTILIKLALAEKGIDAEICSTVHTTHWKLKNKFEGIVSPWGYGNHEYNYLFGFAERFHREFLKVIFWQEQIINKFGREFSRPKGKMATAVDTHLVWGEYYGKFLVENGVSPEKIFIVGSPRLDLLTPFFEDLIPDKSFLSREFGLNKVDFWILFPCSFGGVFIDKRIRKVLIKQGYSDIDKVEKIAEEQLRLFIKMVKRIADFLAEGITIVIRPHPSVPDIFYKKIFNEYKNILVTSKYPISTWLVNSDMIGITSSTTALDAFVIGKKIFRMKFLPESEGMFDFLDFLPTVLKPEEIVDVILQAKEESGDLEEFMGAKNYSEMRSYVEKLFYKIDGFSHLRTAILLGKLIEQRRIKKAPLFSFSKAVPYLIKDLLKEFLLRTGKMGEVMAPRYVNKRKKDLITPELVYDLCLRYKRKVQEAMSNLDSYEFQRGLYGTKVQLKMKEKN